VIKPSAGLPTARPALVLLRAGGVPGVIVGLGVIALGATHSPRASGSAAIGAALALVALSVGPALMAIARTWSPPAVMAIALGGYGVTVLILAVAYVLLTGMDWLAGEWVGAAITAVAVAWPAGLTRGVAKLRVLAYGSPSDRDARGADVNQSGFPESPHEARH
jgi:hypothetical protein